MIENKTITAAEGAELLKALETNEVTNTVVSNKKSAFKMFKIKVTPWSCYSVG